MTSLCSEICQRRAETVKRTVVWCLLGYDDARVINLLFTGDSGGKISYEQASVTD